ncbi:MAG: hypothetical protein Q7S58_13820 [Candidatus Binatus sp.]|uniref:DUF7453 family protein n=1 Tax=Candidatus Binatus sp. TaxID=2811406 RepID=UPI002726CFCB|nr:hypothetical protein [Candidatus Binatus sp.]MDO8433477.1 hypothetical protein [Candidatus Binatus sp.]
MTKFKVLVPAIALLFATAIEAHAVSLTLSGTSGASLEMDGAQAVYASDSIGVSQLITAVSMPSPDGGTITEVGVPSMMPDGRVIFGAEVQPKDTNIKARWTIFIGNADAKPAYRLTAPLNPKAIVGDCVPAFKGDPYPVADADGTIAFMSLVPHGRDALFVYSHGALTCLAKAGIKTNEGHEIGVLGFGSPQIGDDGQIVFNAFLIDKSEKAAGAHRQALLMASKKMGVTELAVEGEYGPNHTEYMRPFGLPSALSSPLGMTIAFTAKTPAGGALFLYSGGTMSRVLTTGTLTALGPVSYLSPGRPGLAIDGTVAVLAGCARTPAIFRLSRQRLDLRIQRGQLTPFGTELDSLGDPVLTASGAMFVGATDTDNREKLYVLSRDDAFFEVGETELIYRIAMAESKRHSIFTGTLTVNQHGDFGYLGGR